ncbi:hypothetical protein FRB90_011348 [Tulasnella sp. 427]|nr:hypothetical protein FRB90_011348 [Tulasnella sp. 427]
MTMACSQAHQEQKWWISSLRVYATSTKPAEARPNDEPVFNFDLSSITMEKAIFEETVKMWGVRAKTVEAERDALKREMDELRRERDIIQERLQEVTQDTERLKAELENTNERLLQSEAEKETERERVRDLLQEVDRLKSSSTPQDLIHHNTHNKVVSGPTQPRQVVKKEEEEEYIKVEEDVKPIILQMGAEVDDLADANAVPEHRRDMLNLLPPINLNLPDEGLGKAFSRPEITKVLGGNPQQATGSEYFAFKHSSNPWLPKSRLEHGFAFVGLPGSRLKDDMIAVDGPVVRPLFVGFRQPEDPLKIGWHYMGTYEFSIPPSHQRPKAEDELGNGEPQFLTVLEWESLTEPFRIEYTKMAASRYGISPSQLAEDYSIGQRGCPFRLAKCVGFNNEIYQRLKARDISQRPMTSKKKAQQSALLALKRKREKDDSNSNSRSKRLQGSNEENFKEEEITMDLE